MATQVVRGLSRALTVGAPIARNLTRKLATTSQVALGQRAATASQVALGQRAATAPLPLSGRPNTYRAHEVLQNIGKFAQPTIELATTQYTRRAGERKRQPRRFNNDAFMMIFARDINIIEGWFRARGGRGGDHILNVIEVIDCIASGYVNEYRNNNIDFNQNNYDNVLTMFQTVWNAQYNRIPITQAANNSLKQLVNIARNNHISLREAWTQLAEEHRHNIENHQRTSAGRAEQDRQMGIIPIQLNPNEPSGGIETLIDHRRRVYERVQQEIDERINALGPADQRMARNILNSFERHYTILMADFPIVIQGGVYPEESNEILHDIFTNQKLLSVESQNELPAVDEVDKSFKSIAKKVSLLSGYNTIKNSSTMIGSLKPSNIQNKLSTMIGSLKPSNIQNKSSTMIGSLKPSNIQNKSSMLGSILLPGQRTSSLLPGYKYGGMKKQKKRRHTRKQKKRRN